MTLIQNILNGYMPDGPNGIKDAIDHCENIIEDCNTTLIDPEVAEHEKANYRQLRGWARTAKAKLKKSNLTVGTNRIRPS